MQELRSGEVKCLAGESIQRKKEREKAVNNHRLIIFCDYKKHILTFFWMVN